MVSDGKVYKQGEVIRNEPCVRCYCPLGGGEPVCDVTACPLSECVDPKEVPGLCCPICPNGPNCQIGLLTLPINQSVVIEGATCACERFVDTDGHTRVSARCNKDIDQTDEREHTDLPL
ncbi:von Willebrand factor c domain-containing 2-like protein [Plakobranchus ocellatus]|uniref:von Willebrand factor c domain-containing 2-like protein n=1 Tax=Plakobranchus ocellatus TaxID=259542 RepID=A0AAV4BS04_9GAST|nr:von Willebrand factor c domain-containing 2-like protein [Plakobranchus ocellatus]